MPKFEYLQQKNNNIVTDEDVARPNLEGYTEIKYEDNDEKIY